MTTLSMDEKVRELVLSGMSPSAALDLELDHRGDVLDLPVDHRVGPDVVEGDGAELRDAVWHDEPTEPDMLAAALDLADRGLAVLPLIGKVPAIPKAQGGHGYKDATTDIGKIKRWWGTVACWDIGFATGAMSGVTVLDIDPRNGGDVTLMQLKQKLGPLPMTPTVLTGGGGTHLVFRYPGCALKAKLGNGLDVKSDGGLTVAPPSMHGSRVRYAWAPGYGLDDLEIAELPENWLALAVERKQKTTSNNGAAPDADGLVPFPDERHELKPWSQDFLANGINPRDDSTQRNRALAVSRALWRAHTPPEEAIALISAALEKSTTDPADPWTRDHAEQIVTSIYSSLPNSDEPEDVPIITDTQPERVDAQVGSEEPIEAVEPEAYSFTPATSNAFVQTFVDWREAVSDAPLEYAEAFAVGTLATVAGARLRVPVRQNPRPMHCALYINILGVSTVSRKSNSLEGATALTEEIMPNSVIASPGSTEGLIQDLARHQEFGAVLPIDELAWWFAGVKKKQHLGDMKGLLMRAYDGSPITRRNRSKTRKQADGSWGTEEDADIAKAPVLTMLGTSTPDRLAQVSTEEDLEDGWWPRWIICWPERRPSIRPLGAADAESNRLYTTVKDALESIDTRLKQPQEAHLTSQAWDAANAASMAFTTAAMQDERHAAFYARTDLRLLKIAALLAVADDPGGMGVVTVEETHVLQAEALCKRWLADALRFAALVGLNDFESALNRAYAAVSRRGTAYRRDVARATHVSARVLDDVERTLLDRGLIELVNISAGGKTARGWRKT